MGAASHGRHHRSSESAHPMTLEEMSRLCDRRITDAPLQEIRRQREAFLKSNSDHIRQFVHDEEQRRKGGREEAARPTTREGGGLAGAPVMRRDSDRGEEERAERDRGRERQTAFQESEESREEEERPVNAPSPDEASGSAEESG